MAEASVSHEKLCTKCGTIKPAGEFSKSKSRKDGLNGHCKRCIKQWRLNNLEEVRAKARARQQSNKERENARAAAWRAANKERAIQNVREWAASNAERKSAIDRLWRERNKDLLRERYRARKVENARRREFRKKQAVPAWANLQAIRDIYEEAERLRSIGSLAEVDHIVPLRSKVVCGLHCESNLRIVGATENRSKGNRWWPDMP